MTYKHAGYVIEEYDDISCSNTAFWRSAAVQDLVLQAEITAIWLFQIPVGLPEIKYFFVVA